MATSSSSPATVDVDVLNVFLQHNMWPASQAQLKALIKKYPTQDKLAAFARTLKPSRTPLRAVPAWVVGDLHKTMGNKAAWAQQDVGLAKILIQSASQGWDADKTAAALDSNRWWNTHSDQQKQWVVASPGQQNHMRLQAAQQMSNQYFQLYGEMKPPSDFMKDGSLDKLASGDINSDQWVGQQRQTQAYKERYPGNAARAAAGLPMLDEQQYRDYEEQYKNELQKAGYDVSKIQPAQLSNFFARDFQPAEVAQRLDAANTLETHGAYLRNQFASLAGLPQGVTSSDFYGMLVGLRPDLKQQYAKATGASVDSLPSLQDVTNALKKAEGYQKAEFSGGGSVAQPTPTGQKSVEQVPAEMQAAF